MNGFALVVLFKTKEGKRDQLKAIREKYVKEHAEDSEDLLFNTYNFGAEDPNRVVLFEMMKGEETQK